MDTDVFRLTVSEAMSISPERRQPVTGAHQSTPASRDGRPCRQLRFMADMRATTPGAAPTPIKKQVPWPQFYSNRCPRHFLSSI